MNYLAYLSEQTRAPLLRYYYLTYRNTSTPVHCRICQRADKWQIESNSYVCEHEPPEGVLIRCLDDIRQDMADVKEVRIA